MKNYIYILCFLSTISSFSQGEFECGTTMTEEHLPLFEKHEESMDNLYVNFDVADITSRITLKLKIHVIRRTDGTDGLSESEVSLSIEQLIERFEQANISFEHCDNINYIDNSAYFEKIEYSTIEDYPSESNPDEYEMAIPNLDNTAINIFYAPTIIAEGKSACGWASFPTYEERYNKNWIIMKNSCATNGSTLAHEVGHYFNLLHTHHSSGIFNWEKVDRSGDCSNCETTGDLLCDTPADMPWSTLRDDVNENCEYIGDHVDFCGQPYDPDTTNLMSYSTRECRDFFSTGQIDRMLLSLATDRTNLSSSCNGCSLEISVTNDVNFGETNEQSASSLIEANNTISNNAIAIYHAGEEVLLTDGFVAESGSSFDGYIEGCETLSSKSIAKSIANRPTVINLSTELIIDEITHNSLTVYPNPTNGLFTIESNKLVTSYSINNIIGQQVIFEEAVNLNTLNVDISNFTNGVYFLELQTENGEIITKKVIKK